MAPTRRVNTPVPAPLIRAALLVLAAGPAGWLAAIVVRRLSAGDQDGGGARAGPRPPTAAIIAAMALAFAWIALRGPGPWPLLLASLVLAWVLVCLAAVDLAVYRLPDVLTLPLMASGLAVTLLLPGRPVADHLAGAMAGWGLLAALAWGFRRWRGADGMGLGDAKLFGAAGAWLGWAALPSAMLIACVAAFLLIGGRMLRHGRIAMRERIAFGAPLSLAIFAVWLEGPLVI